MRSQAALFAIIALFASLAFGQPRVFQFTHTDAQQDRQQIASAVGTMAEIRGLAPDPQGTLTVNGTASQLGLAEWLFNELDQRPSPSTHEYRLSTGDDVVRVFYLPHTATAPDLQEAAVMVRTISDIRWASTCNVSKAVVLRGTAQEIALADWLFNQVDQPKPIAAPSDYHLTGGGDNTIRVLYATHTPTVQEFQEVAVVVRTIGDIRRVFTYNAPRAIAIRGTADQIALAQWMLSEFNKKTQTPATYQYLSGGGDNVVRLTYLPHTATVEAFQKMATEIRAETGIRRVFTYNTPRALALRGTVDQIAMADRLILELDK